MQSYLCQIKERLKSTQSCFSVSNRYRLMPNLRYRYQKWKKCISAFLHDAKIQSYSGFLFSTTGVWRQRQMKFAKTSKMYSRQKQFKNQIVLSLIQINPSYFSSCFVFLFHSITLCCRSTAHQSRHCDLIWWPWRGWDFHARKMLIK